MIKHQSQLNFHTMRSGSGLLYRCETLYTLTNSTIVMIKYIVMAVMITVSIQIRAQDTESLFSNDFPYRFAWSIDLNSQPIRKQVGTSIGVTGGYIVDEALFAALSVQSNVTHSKINTGSIALHLQVINRPEKLYHWSIQANIGRGGVKDYQHTKSGMMDSFADVFGAGYFFAEPSALFEVNLTRKIRLATGFGYRIAFGLDTDDPNIAISKVTNSDLSGIVWNLSVRFE